MERKIISRNRIYVYAFIALESLLLAVILGYMMV